MWSWCRSREPSEKNMLRRSGERAEIGLSTATLRLTEYSVPSTKYSVLSTKYTVRAAQGFTSAALLALCCFVSIASAQDAAQTQEEQAIRAAVERVAPSVVKIETIGGLERVGKVLVNLGPTTGLVVGEDGYIISSAFNFIQQPSSILVTLPGGTRKAAQIVARDKSKMLVLLKVATSDKLPVSAAVPRSEMTVGQWTIALGRTFEQAAPNVSVGVLSATNRIWSTAIQTDAKISPANYGGPLIDIHGRVLGVLVPLSPQKQGSEVAGAEWYDSGIGFAVPLADIIERLPALKEGKDLHPGLMGISLKPGDPYSSRAELAAAQAGSPAYKAGLRAGDTIVELDSEQIERQSQLKHALGPRYAGDKVRVVYTRGKESPERKETEVELVERLIPYEHPFLGILPLRDGSGVRVRYVYPSSPAAIAGIEPGDRVVASGQTEVTDAAQLRLIVANQEPGTSLALKIDRKGESRTFELKPGKLPTAIPGELPPASAEPPVAKPADAPETGLVDIKLPEAKNQCVAYVPENYHPDVPHGLVVVVSAPGAVDREKLASRWKSVCAERNMIVLAPMSEASDKWQATETEFIKKTLDDVIGRYNIDATRIATYGYQAGGAMACLFAFENLERIRAIAAIDATPPTRTRLPETDPVNRLAFFIGRAEKSPAAALQKALLEALQGAKHPVTVHGLGDEPRDLTAEELSSLGRWLDALDRI
jgi:serine protease Do